MKTVGDKTQAIHQRCAIADEAILKDAAEKLGKLHSVDAERRNDRVRHDLESASAQFERVV